MRPSPLAVALLSAAASQPVASPAAARDSIAIARIAFVDDLVEVQSAGKGWSRLLEGAQLRIGDKLRTGPRAKARIDFPWMTVALSGSSQISVPDSRVLAMLLEAGRVEQVSPSGEMIKLLTAEASIRGAGRVAVRRERGRTLVSAFAGSFRVEGRGKSVELAAGEGTVVAGGVAPRLPAPLPPAPLELHPSDDPLYVGLNEPITLRFLSPAKAHYLQVLAVHSSQPLIEMDLAGSPAAISIPWPGTFRWRVSARDREGLEGLPSREGWIAVVAK